MSTEFDPVHDLRHMGMQNGALICKYPEHSGPEVTDWCEHINRYVQSGQDSEMLRPGLRIQVPIFPSQAIFAAVAISDDVVGVSALMELEYTPDIGRSVKIPLGFWNPGEGMRSIRFVILDYLLSKVHPDENFTAGPIKTKCPNGAHSMKSSRLMSEKSANDTQWKWRCLWNIVMEKACTPCVEESSGTSDNNFGIDDSVLNSGSSRPWQTRNFSSNA